MDAFDVDHESGLNAICACFVIWFIRRSIEKDLFFRHRIDFHFRMLMEGSHIRNILLIIQADQRHTGEDVMLPSLQHVDHTIRISPVNRLAEHFPITRNDCVCANDDRIIRQFHTVFRILNACRQIILSLFIY